MEGLKHNLLSVSQICDNGYSISFNAKGCYIKNGKDRIIASGLRMRGNLYNLIDSTIQETSLVNTCLMSQVEENWLWHRRLGHLNFDNLARISKNKKVRGLPQITKPESICEECVKGKQTRVCFRTKEYSSNRPLELVHTDLCGPTKTTSLNGEKYFMLFIDDYSRMVWVTFLKHKSEAFERFKIFRKMVERETDLKLKCLRSDRGGEFISQGFIEYCEKHGIKRQYSTARTPHQNGVVERKNRTIKEMARTMLNDK